ncbi:MAG: tetratricopeptide repeat protein [Chloroflexi bacterium]|nr:tetratricopeptide repeat protein [Chloroflexota bacterium]
MTYQEGQAKLKQQRSNQAVALAMQGQWREAIAVNKSIIESFSNDVEAYNRLGRAYMELGEYPQARKAYQQAMELGPFNTIAQKNLRRLEHLVETSPVAEGEANKVEPHHFIEEIGKAGIVNLYNLAPKKILAKATSGDKVNLKIEGNILKAENRLGESLGQVEARHAQRLIKLMTGGNRYSAAIVSAADDKITVIIREEFQDPSQIGQLSFPPQTLKSTRLSANDKVAHPEFEYAEEMPEEKHDINHQLANNED